MSPRSGLRIVGSLLLGLGILGLIGAALLALAPGFRLAPPVAFGTTMTVELAAGDQAIYVTPSHQWSAISCTGTLGDSGELQLRPDMAQQGVLLPTRWDAQGSFAVDTAGTATISCNGPVADGQFTVGPVVSFFSLAGAALLGIPAVVLLIVGIVLVAVRPRHPIA